MALIGFLDILLAAICFLILRYCLRNNNGSLNNFPIVGMLPQLLLNVHRSHDWCTELLERNQCTFLLKGPWFANMDLFITVDPANIHYILSSNFSNFPKGPEFKQIFDVLGDGIFNSDSDLWKSQRKFAQSLINHHSFHKFLVKSNEAKVEKGLIPVLDHVSGQGMTVDLQDVFQRLTFDSTCILVTSYDPGCLSAEFPDVQFAKALEDAEESIFYRHIVPESLWKLQRFLGIGQEKKMKKATETLNKVIFGYIQRKRKELKDGISSTEVDGVDLLTSYMKENKSFRDLKSNDDDDERFLRDTILNFMIAGRDTTSSALTWFFWLVSKNPDAETKIRQELKSITPADHKFGKWWQFNTQDLNRLVYFHGAFCEALRLYPPVPFQHKAPLLQDTLPSGHRAVPRTKILFSLYAMGRMKCIWGEDCLEFKPERWVSETGRIKQEPSYKFLSFNAGPRTCIGKEVAFNQMKAVAAAIIHNYDVQVVEGQHLKPNVSIILNMKNGLKVRVHGRETRENHQQIMAISRSLEKTPTWALALVCFVIISISIILEHAIHLLTDWLKRLQRNALIDAVEKLKSELMLLGFMSLILGVTQTSISKICIPTNIANIMLPCRKPAESQSPKVANYEHFSSKNINIGNLLSVHNLWRDLADDDNDAIAVSDSCATQGKVSLISKDGIYQLHMFIFVLAVMQIVYSVLTMALGRAKMRRWKAWEKETQTTEYQVVNDPERFRFTRQTTFGRRHVAYFTQTSFHLWIKCFFRQFFHSLAKVDYLTLRHGFISAHMSSSSYTTFNFQKFIQRSLEEDFKLVVGISPLMWSVVVIFLLMDVYGWHVYLWISYVPLGIVLVLGTKLESIVVKMALQINEQTSVIKGTPLVQPSDTLFWFGRPRFVLFLLHITLFMNAFELAFFIWVSIQFGVDSCYHEHTAITVARVLLPIAVQVLCSYITLPLYALITQMGSEFKIKVLGEQTAKIIKQWHSEVRERRKKEEHYSVRSAGNSTEFYSLRRPASMLRESNQHYKGEITEAQGEASSSRPPSPLVMLE